MVLREEPLFFGRPLQRQTIMFFLKLICESGKIFGGVDACCTNFVPSFLTADADADNSLADLLIMMMEVIPGMIYDDHDHGHS